MVRLTVTSAALLATMMGSSNAAFAPSVALTSGTSLRNVALNALSPGEAAARAQGAAVIKEPEPAPLLFDDNLLNDMQQCLLKLERRVKEGPGALSVLEVEELDFASRRILSEMKKNEHNRPKPVPAFPDGPPLPASPATTAPVAAQTTTPQGAAKSPVAAVAPQKIFTDTSDDEGPAYDGMGGLGLAKGTANTYIIPGMEEMSPEEYRAALQQSVIDRQKRRVSSGVTGNRAAWDYLQSLTGQSGVLKKSEYEQ